MTVLTQMHQPDNRAPHVATHQSADTQIPPQFSSAAQYDESAPKSHHNNHHPAPNDTPFCQFLPENCGTFRLPEPRERSDLPVEYGVNHKRNWRGSI